MVSDREVIAALQATETKTEAAKLLGISRQALYERMRRPEFMELLQLLAEAENTALEGVRENAVTHALEYLDDVIQDRNIFGYSDKDRLKACEILLKYNNTISSIVGGND